MKRSEAIRSVLEGLKENDIALFATGMTSREAFSIKDRPNNFYIIGSMGLISSIGLGIALNTKKKVYLFDGDGSILMEMGTLAQIGAEAPKNLVHICLDNQAYQSTGSQPTISNKVDLAKIAEAAGYGAANGPEFNLMKVENDEGEPPPRVSVSPEQMASRLMRSIK